MRRIEGLVNGRTQVGAMQVHTPVRRTDAENLSPPLLEVALQLARNGPRGTVDQRQALKPEGGQIGRDAVDRQLGRQLSEQFPQPGAEVIGQPPRALEEEL